MSRTVIILLAMPLLVSCASTNRAVSTQSPDIHSPYAVEERDRQSIRFSDCPPLVQRRLSAEAAGGRIASIEEDDEDGATSFTAHVLIGQRLYSIRVDQDGVLQEKTLENESERKVKLLDCPQAVQRTFRQEAGKVPIEEVERDVCNGVVCYIAEVELGGLYYWITVAENGALLSKVLDCPEYDDDPENGPSQTRV
jgi:hypothetical protein